MDKQDISIIDLVLALRKVIRLIKQKIVFLLSVVLLFCLIGFFFKREKEFVAKTSLLLNSNKSTGGGLMNLASEFGVITQEGVDFDKFKNIIKSDYILTKILLSSGFVDYNDDLIIHHLRANVNISANKLRNSTMSTLDFNKNGLGQDTAMLFFRPFISKMISVSETEGSLTLIQVRSSNADLAILISKVAIKEAIKFYKKISTSDEVETYKILEQKADSIKKELYAKEQVFATLKDNSFQTVKRVGYLEILRADRNIRVLNEMYLEVMKQKEMVNFKIQNNNPSIKILDTPSLPLTNKESSYLYLLIVFGFIGLIIGLALIIAVDYYKKINSTIIRIEQK